MAATNAINPRRITNSCRSPLISLPVKRTRVAVSDAGCSDLFGGTPASGVAFQHSLQDSGEVQPFAQGRIGRIRLEMSLQPFRQIEHSVFGFRAFGLRMTAREAGLAAEGHRCHFRTGPPSDADPGLGINRSRQRSLDIISRHAKLADRS